MPSTRQISSGETESKSRRADSRLLVRAFATFTEAAGSLEKSYGQLQAEVSKLRSDLEQANAKLSRSLDENARARAFLAQVLDSLPCGVVVSHSDGVVRLFNPEAQRLLELEVHSDASARLPEWFSQLAQDKPYAEHERSLGAPTEKRTLAVTMTPMQIEPGVEPETIWIVRDISDQKRFAAEREESRRTHALAEIATVLAHEIRNPLASMELFSGLLNEATRFMPEAHQWAIHLQSGLRSLGATVNNVLQFHGKSSCEFLPVRLDRALEHAVEFLSPLAATQGLTIGMDNLVGAVTVAGDAYCLRQVFLNIVLNGFRAMTQGGNLTIHIDWAPHFQSRLLKIDFRDEGHGIESSLLDEIFEPGVTTKRGSPGLGLAVCKRVVEQHRGTIHVKSQQGRGSTFTIYLPALEEFVE